MFSKKPVLASVDAESDTAMCILDNHAGWVALPEDAESVAKAMKEAYLLSGEELNRLGKNGFEFAVETLSRRNLKKLTDACLDVIRSK